MTRERLFEVLTMPCPQRAALIARHIKRGHTRALMVISEASSLVACEAQAVRRFGYVLSEADSLDLIRQCCRTVLPSKPIGKVVQTSDIKLLS